MNLRDQMNLRTGQIPPQSASNKTKSRAFPVLDLGFEPSSQRRRPSGMLAMAALLLVAAGAQAQSVFATWQNVGSTAAAQNVTVIAQAAGTVKTVEVLSNGVTGAAIATPEFAKGTGTLSCESATLTVGGACQESVTFTPSYPGLRAGAVVLLDGNGNVLGTAYLSGVGQGGLDVLVPGNQIEIAGEFQKVGSTQNDILAIAAYLQQPAGVALDGAGNLYLADSAHNQIRMICFSATSATIKGATCPGAGMIIAIAGTGSAGYSGDNDPASSANVTLNAPGGLSLDGAGNLYVADTANNAIRKITAATGVITTVAGNGTLGFGGDGAAATSAQLDTPWGVTVDPAGNIYIADTYNQRIRRVDAVTGIITTAAGDGKTSGLGDGKGSFGGDDGPANAAGLSLPYAVAFDAYGDMFIPDSGNNLIRVVHATNGVVTATSKITTEAGTTAAGVGIAGNGCVDGPTNATPLNSPEGVAIDAAFNLYISDTGDKCIRKANVTSGQMTQLALTNDYAITLAGVPDQLEVYAPMGIIVDGLGNVYYADYYNMQIDEIQSDVAVLNFQGTPIRQGDLSAPQSQVVENDGNASSNVTGISSDQNAQIDAGTTTCNPTTSTPFILPEDQDCHIGAVFAPSTAINPATLPGTVTGNIYVADNTVNAKLDIVLVGDATPVNSTTITLTSAPDPSAFGQSVAFTATVTTGANTGALTGTVTFTDTFNGVTTQLSIPAVTVKALGVAIFNTAKLAVGVHTISASYNGDTLHLKSDTPATVTQTVFEATTTTVAAIPASPSQLGQSVTFTATVTTPNGGGVALDGSVTFTDSLATFTNNTAAINGGEATFTANNLVQGVNVITASYTPATTKLIQGSQSTLNQDVVAPATMTLTSAPNPSTFGTQVTYTVTVPNQGSVAATGTVNIAIVAVGQTTPTYPLTVTLAGNPATGTGAISTLPVGAYNATATYAGDTNYGAASGTLATPQVVNQVQTATKLAATPNPGTAGQPVAITATVTPSSGTAAPTGTVTFTATLNGVNVPLSGASNVALASGAATINPTLGPGTYTIAATYSGNANDAGSNATFSLVMDQAATSTVVTATPNPALVGSTITFSATVTTNPAGGAPTGAVNFLANGTIALGTANVDPTGKATVTNATLAAASYQITAVYAGDTNDAGSTSAAITEVVGVIPTDTTLSTATATGANSQTILVSTVQNAGVVGPIPTGTVTFQNGATVVGTATLNADGVATLSPNLGAGTFTIIAYYQGDATHGPSQSTPVSVSSTGSSFTLTVTPGSVTIPTTQNTTVTVTLASISGFADTIGLGCASLPAGVNCHFSSISVPLAANGTATAQLTIDTNNPLGGGATAMNRQASDSKVALAGLFLPLSLFLGWILWRFRKRHGSVWSVVLILVLSGAAILATGCGGFTQNSAAPGTYTIQVVGVGANSDVTEYQNVTLNITK